MRSWLSCKVGNVITIIHARDLRLQESAIAAEYGPPTQVRRPQPQFLATKLSQLQVQISPVVQRFRDGYCLMSPRSQLQGVTKVYRIKLYPHS